MRFCLYRAVPITPLFSQISLACAIEMINTEETIKKRLERVCTEKCIPLYTIFELTYRCNLRCRHCYAPEYCDNELTALEIESIMDQLVRIGTFNLIFTGGEIFTRRDFFPIAWAAKTRGFFLTLMTNGTLINRDNIDEIANLKPRGVEISLYGANAKTHDFVAQTSGSFDKAVNSIRLLVDRGIRVVTKTVVMNSNIEEVEEIRELSINLGAIPNIGFGILPKKDGSLLPLKHDLSFENADFYFAQGFDTKFKPKFGQNPLNKLSCKAGKALCSISPSGDVSPCLLMPIKLGNLQEQSFKDIWYQRGNKLLDSLRARDTYKTSTCLNCESLEFCARCPGAVYLETGDPFGPSPSACRYAKLREKAYSEGGE